MTIMRRAEAASAGSQHRGLDVVGSRSDGTNVSHAESNRHLMTAEEIGRLRKDQSILLVRGHRPVMARRVRYFPHPSFAEIGRAHGCTPDTTAPLVCRPLLDKKKKI